MSLVTIPVNFIEDPNFNFWAHNNQLIIMQPFSALYNADKSKNKENSSKTMSVIFLMCEPDEDKNVFFRIPYEQRLKMLKETYYPKFDEDDPLVEECLEKYPLLCLTPVARALKEEIESLVARAKFITKESKNLTLDRTEILEGKLVVIKGNAVQLDSMKAKTVKLYEDYDRLEKKFLKERQEARIYGGRRKSKSEKKLL